jgi:alpha-tubulin suppressor-like RCC1 family protein
VLGLVALVVATVGAPSAVAKSPQSGTVVGWGSTYALPAGLSGITALDVGDDGHIVVAKDDGTVAAWGFNNWGQCNVPAGLNDVIAVAAGTAHSVALRADGTVVAWGYWPATGVPPGLNNVVAIAAGSAHTLALKSDGTVVAWGMNSFGETSVPASLNHVTAIAAGGEHSLAVKSDGTVVAWGWNDFGQTNVPTGLNGVTAVAGGYVDSLALKRDGTVVEWGDNPWYSNDSDVPAGLNNVVAIDAGYDHNLALKRDGTVVAWGVNGNGQTNVPTGLSHVIAIAAGGATSLALVGPADTTPPVINVPPDITADATGPNGTSVTFAVSATDPDDQVASLNCTPTSGSSFSIGTTVVACAASDTNGNSATAGFSVHVRGAAEQLSTLHDRVVGLGPGTSLHDKIAVAQTALAAHDITGACAILDAFINEVKAQSGKKVPSDTAAGLISDATRIKSVLGH